MVVIEDSGFTQKKKKKKKNGSISKIGQKSQFFKIGHL